MLLASSTKTVQQIHREKHLPDSAEHRRFFEVEQQLCQSCQSHAHREPKGPAAKEPKHTNVWEEEGFSQALNSPGSRLLGPASWCRINKQQRCGRACEWQPPPQRGKPVSFQTKKYGENAKLIFNRKAGIGISNQS